jgi:hypothetical protein
MQIHRRIVLILALVSLTAITPQAQSGDEKANAQEAFAMAVAKAHARISPFSKGSHPFMLQAKVTSYLALHGAGNGSYVDKWVDAQHWEHTVQFPDFQQVEMRNDEGRPWIQRSSGFVPNRIEQMLWLVTLHLPSSNTATSYSVVESRVTGGQSQALDCFSAELPTPHDGYPRHRRWCFDAATGLLDSEDFPLNVHVVFSDYIAFQGKQVFTKVKATSGDLLILEMEISYTPMDPHALDALPPAPGMARAKPNEGPPNPEEMERGTAEFTPNANLPAGTSAEDANKPAVVWLVLGPDDKPPLDVSVERAPTQAMAEAALEAAQKYTFTPLLVDGKPSRNGFFYSVWFSEKRTDAATPANAAASPERLDKLAKSGAVAPMPLSPEGRYQNDKPAFLVRYPEDFRLLPQGQIDEKRRRALAALPEGLAKSAEQCNKVLFEAARLRSGYRSEEVVSLVDLVPACVFGKLRPDDLETTAVNGARTMMAKWKSETVYKAKYKVDGRNFAIVSASGTTTSMPVINLVEVVTEIGGHVFIWTLVGPAPDLLKTFEEFTLQVGDKRENSLVPPGFAVTP